MTTLLGGCSLFSDTETALMPIDRVTFVRQSKQQVVFSVQGIWRNTCGRFSHFETTQDAKHYTIRMYGKEREGMICGQALTPIEKNWEMVGRSGEAYTFHFWQSDSTTLDTVIVIK